MPASEQTPAIRTFVTRTFKVVEDLIYLALGVLLAVSAFAFLYVSTDAFIHNLAAGTLTGHIATLLSRLLLVLLIVELLYTVQVSFRAGTILPEPFLFVGLIAAIRRVFVLTAEFAKIGENSTTAFEHLVIELGVLTALILVIAVSLLLLRISNKYVQEEPRPGP